ncbi:MAG: hypothetical protein ACOCSO_03380, partial [Thermoplasmatota archaeon]
LEATSENLRRNVLPLVQEGKLIVLTGYYGCDEEGRPLTLGRGDRTTPPGWWPTALTPTAWRYGPTSTGS